MSILGKDGGTASASVIADSEKVLLYATEMSFINKLFETEPGTTETTGHVTYLI